MYKLMKTIKQTIILAIVLFAFATVLTFRHEANADGFDVYGFPFRFYKFTSAKQFELFEQTGFDIINLTLDLIIIAALAFVLVKVKNKYFKRTNE
jgi:hypothetical protein